jgi:hypothetical protein
MTYDGAIKAAKLLEANGLGEAADKMWEAAEVARKTAHEELMAACLDDPDFDLAISEDKMEMACGPWG